MARILIMRGFVCFLLLSTFSTAPVLAETCPAPPDRSLERAGLFEELLAAPNEASAIQIANMIWEIWIDAPDDKSQAMLDEGMKRREVYAYSEAETIFDALTDYCPNYAEGWNQRAFVRFLREDFDGSLEDIERVLVLEPNHFGALSGKALTLMGQGKTGLGKLTILQALKVHPWLRERAIVADTPEQDL